MPASPNAGSSAPPAPAWTPSVSPICAGPKRGNASHSGASTKRRRPRRRGTSRTASNGAARSRRL
eukprot:11186465-Lingulodinium_polyedra.AAC.1